MKKIRLIIPLVLLAVFIFSCDKKDKEEEQEIPQDYTCVCTWPDGSGTQTASVKIKNSLQNDAQVACSALESNYVGATCALQ